LDSQLSSSRSLGVCHMWEDKWESLYGDYKINGYKSVTSHNENY
jgi:hypothetical protein